MRHLEILAQQIASRGVKHVFGIPGSGPSLFFLDKLKKNGVQFHLTHFEGTAAMMAGAIGKLSGQSGVAVSIKGPGLSNMIPGLAVCTLDAFPMISISEAYPPGTPIEKSHKRLNHNKLTAGVTKHCYFLSDQSPDFNLLSELAEAEVPGVVHLDIAASTGQVSNFKKDSKRENIKFNLGGKVKEILKSSKRPVIIAGTLVLRAGWSDKLNSLSLPVFSTSAAKGAINESLPHAAGIYTGVGGLLSPEKKILPLSDLVIGIGLRHNEVLGIPSFHCPSIQIDPLGSQKSYGFNFDAYIEGKPSEIEELFTALAKKQWGLEIVKKSLSNLWDHMLRPAFLPARIFRCIEDYFKNKARIVLDTGNFCTIGEHAWRVFFPEWYVASGQGRYMGVALAQGIGAAIYDPSIPTIVFTGDGGIGMFISEVKLAVQNKLPLLIVLLSDGYLGTIRDASLEKGLTQYPATIHQPSWINILEGFEVPGVRIDSLNFLEKTLVDWDRKSPLYIEVQFDADNYRHMTQGIR